MKTKDEIINELDHFTGTENYYRMHHNTLLTDGVKYLCEECKAFWLMDVIWSYLPQVPVDEYFLVVKFDVRVRTVGSGWETTPRLRTWTSHRRPASPTFPSTPSPSTCPAWVTSG